MDSNRSGRRGFLKTAALAGLAVGAARSSNGQEATAPASPSGTHAHGEPSRLATAPGRVITRSVTHTTYYTPLAESVGIITPASLHFMQAHSHLPDIDPAKYSLTVHGMVDRPLVFSLEDLKRLPSASRIHFLECLGNSVPQRHVSDSKLPVVTVQTTHGLTSCSEWAGVPMSVLLKEVGVKKEASWLVAEGSDESKFTYCIPLTKANDDVLVAYMQNGEPLRQEQGFPVRMFVPGWGANHSVKWLRRIMVVDRPYMTWDQSVHHSTVRADLAGKSRWYSFVWPPKSVITRPSAGQTLPGPGYFEITGLAWSGWGKVSKVEISVNGGKTWKEAKIQDPVLPKAHTRFNFDWTWNGEEAVLQSRCTDDQGEVQPTYAEICRNWGQAPTSGSFYWNAIQPWKVARDGSITDAVFA